MNGAFVEVWLEPEMRQSRQFSSGGCVSLQVMWIYGVDLIDDPHIFPETTACGPG